MAPRFLTPLQRRRIQQAIRDGHLAFLAEFFGPTAIDPDDFARLRAAGKIREEKLLPQDIAIAAHTLGSIAGEETMGSLAQMSHEAERDAIAEIHGLSPAHAARVFDIDDPTKYQKLVPDAFWRQVREDPQVITDAEHEAITLMRDRIGQHVRGLGNRLDTNTGRVLVDADDKLRRRRLTKVQREVVRGVEERTTAQEVARRIRDATKDLKRDWLRTAHTEMHNAVEEAKAIVLAHRSDDRDPRVFKRPHPDGCAFCVLLYLRQDKVTPRVFRLSELLANGTNVGRKANRPSRSGKSRTEWRATIGAIHPFCRCPLSVLPPGMGFDALGQMTYVGMKKSIAVESLDKALLDHECSEE
jgi:hypothetical protein